MSKNIQETDISKEDLLAIRLFKTIFEGNAAGIFVVDEHRNIIMANQRVCEILGFTKEELIGQNASFAHLSQEAYEQFRTYYLKAKDEGRSKIEYFVRKKDTDGIWVEMFGSPIELDVNRFGVIWSILDISERKMAEEAIKELAFYDPLTRLANRRLLEDRLSIMIESKKRTKNYSAIIFLDLDDFKGLNDTYGHLTGDRFLKEIAARLQNSVRSADTVSRLGGDEFVIIIDHLSSAKDRAKEQMKVISTNILETLKTPYTLPVSDSNHTSSILHTTSASVGVKLFNCTDYRADALLREADEAMYQAKKSGKNRICFFGNLSKCSI